MSMMRFIYLSIYHLCCHYIILFAISTSDFYKNLSVALTLYCTSHPDVNRTTYLIQLNLLSHRKIIAVCPNLARNQRN